MLTYEELIKQYGDRLVNFASYYKYEFTFTNDFDKSISKLYVIVGADEGEIYRLDVDPLIKKINDLKSIYKVYENGNLIYKREE